MENKAKIWYVPQVSFFSIEINFFFHYINCITRRQRLFVEMEQMASRPFSHVLVELQVPASFPRRAVYVPHHSCPSEGRSQIIQHTAPPLNNPVTTVETSFSSSSSVNPSSSNATAITSHVRRRRRVRSLFHKFAYHLYLPFLKFVIINNFSSFDRVLLHWNLVLTKKLLSCHYWSDFLTELSLIHHQGNPVLRLRLLFRSELLNFFKTINFRASYCFNTSFVRFLCEPQEQS